MTAIGRRLAGRKRIWIQEYHRLREGHGYYHEEEYTERIYCYRARTVREQCGEAAGGKWVQGTRYRPSGKAGESDCRLCDACHVCRCCERGSVERIGRQKF